MTPGKTASQAGHAYLGSFLQASPDVQAEYHANGIGTKVCLMGRLSRLLRYHEQAKAEGAPCFLVVDSGCPDFFGGEPTVTALGIGPATKEQVQHITGRFCLMP